MRYTLNKIGRKNIKKQIEGQYFNKQRFLKYLNF